MVKDFHIRSDCRLCSGPIAKVLELPDTPLANEYPPAPIPGGQQLFPLYLSRCQDCGHVQLPVVVNPERLFRDYAYQSSTSPVFREHLERFAFDVQPARHGSLVVEIGSNDGTLLAEYRKWSLLGYRVLGVDPARNLVDAANAGGVDTIPAFFSVDVARDILAKHGPADLVVALNVFAHADDLAGITQGVAELLAPDGKFVFEVGHLAAMVACGIYSTIYHEHLSYHHAHALLPFLKRFGLHIHDVRAVNTQGGSIRVTAGKEELPADGAFGSRQLAQMLRWLLGDSPNLWERVPVLADCIAADKARIRQKLDSLKAAGKTVCGYGAPAQLTTLCYALGITREDVSFIVDDNQLKQGRYTPGRFIPITSPGNLAYSDACIIFSSNFAEDIRKRHAAYTGEWVTL